MHPIVERVASKLPHLPDGPGVYLFRSADGTMLYVGKAARLRSRVRSYFATAHVESPKTRHLVGQIADVDTIVVPTEAHALILEANLIKEHRPRFNIALRDDKTYPYIRVTLQEPYPRVFVTRRLVNDGARHFGPYTDVTQMRRTLNVVKRIFTVRSCNYDMPREMPERPCLDYFIKRCKAPCVLAQSQADYRAMIDEVVLFLSGHRDEVRRRIRQRMDEAAEALDYERAAELRDALTHLDHMEEPTSVLEVEGGDRDVIGFARDGDDACAVLLRIRGGKLLGRDHRFLENLDEEPDAAALAVFLAGSYMVMAERAREVLLPFDFPDRQLLEEPLGGARLLVPQRGPKRELVALADQNARHLLEELRLSALEADERASNPVYELQRELGMHRLPRSMVCFDVSTAQGTDTVGSAIWFENARPRRAEYRKFRVKTVEGTDDFAAMRELVSRYFGRRLEEGKPLPDLVVIDGGRGQLSAAHTAMSELNLGDRALISLAKRDEDVYVWGRPEPVRLSRRSPALRLLQQARDEAHRFALTYQRKRRTMRTVTSALLDIPGIGPSKRRQLLAEFGSIEGVRAAGVEAIARLRGFSAESARRLLAALEERSPTRPSAHPGEPEADEEARRPESVRDGENTAGRSTVTP